MRERYKAIKYLHGTADFKKFNSLDFSNNRTVENIFNRGRSSLGQEYTYFFFFYRTLKWIKVPAVIENHMLEISATILQRAKARRRGSELAFKRPISSLKYSEYAGISRSGVEGRVGTRNFRVTRYCRPTCRRAIFRDLKTPVIIYVHRAIFESKVASKKKKEREKKEIEIHSTMYIVRRMPRVQFIIADGKDFSNDPLSYPTENPAFFRQK